MGALLEVLEGLPQVAPNIHDGVVRDKRESPHLIIAEAHPGCTKLTSGWEVIYDVVSPDLLRLTRIRTG